MYAISLPPHLNPLPRWGEEGKKMFLSLGGRVRGGGNYHEGASVSSPLNTFIKMI